MVILNYKVRHFLELCLESVVRATHLIDSEIIVVDNHSQDNSCQMVKSRFPGVILIENNENFGFPKGNNMGVAAAKGQFICILNPDTIVPEHFFKELLACAKSQSNLGIIGCQLLDGAGNYLPESKRGVPTPWVALTKIFGLYQLFPKSALFNQYYAGHLSENESGKVSILVGAMMFMKKSIYEKVGGFDEACFMYSDDIDLSYLVLKLGLDNYYYADLQAIHFKGESTIKDQKYIQRLQEAMDFFYAKHFKKSSLFNVGMKIGAFIFVHFKAKKKGFEMEYPNKVVLLSKNQHLEKKLETMFLKQDFHVYHEISNQNLLLNLKEQIRTEIILDTESFSFREIIDFMYQNKQKNLTFKFILSHQDFLIGSNHSESRGEIINLI